MDELKHVTALTKPLHIQLSLSQEQADEPDAQERRMLVLNRHELKLPLTKRLPVTKPLPLACSEQK